MIRMFNYLITATRTGAKARDMTRILPTWLYGYLAKWNIKDVKHLIAGLEEFDKRLAEADRAVNIELVDAALKGWFKTALGAEEHIHKGEEDVFVMEYRDLELLREFNKEFKKLETNRDFMQRFPELATRVKAEAEKYDRLIAQIKTKIDHTRDEIRDEKLMREDRLRDFTFRQLFLVYFQMKMACNEMRRKSSTVKSGEHDMVKQIHNILKHLNSPQAEEKYMRLLERDFDKFVAAFELVVKDATNVETLLIKVRQRLIERINEKKHKMQDFKGEGFPDEDLQQITESVLEKLEQEIREDVEADDAQARLMEHEVDEAK